MGGTWAFRMALFPAMSEACPMPSAAGWRHNVLWKHSPKTRTAMDDIVRQAIAKWPNVPDCYGWLGLDARGAWYMRDDRVQALGPFSGGGQEAKGSLLKHEKLVEFIQ